jgi:hypothetical protein
MARGLTAMELPPPDLNQTSINTTLAYSSFGRMTQSPATRITSQDVVVVERYIPNQLTGIYQVPPFDQTEGTDPITANMVPVPANKPLAATITPSTYASRFSAVRPAVSGLSQGWNVVAAPGWSIGATAGPLLRAGGSAMTDTSISTMFGNPFESLDWRSLFQFAATETRSYTFMGMAIGLSAQMYNLVEPPATGSITVDMAAGLPVNIRANEVPLSVDGMAVMLDLTKPIEVDAITDNAKATVYYATLYEVALSSDGTSVTRTPIVEAATTGEPKLKFPQELFQVGHYYYFDFRCVLGGFMNAAMGDFQTLTLPYTVSRADSAVFQVVMQ